MRARWEKSFERGREPFQTFSDLVALRNNIFHFKPPADADNSKPHKQSFSSVVTNPELGKSYFDVVEKMIRKLHELTDGKTEIPQFLDGIEYLTTKRIWIDLDVPLSFEGSGGLDVDANVIRALPDTDTTPKGDQPD
jgi:hypothetical protein